MMSNPIHIRTQSAAPCFHTAAPSRTHARPELGNDCNSYNSTDCSVKLVDHTGDSYQDLQLPAPPKAAISTNKSALGSRFLTSLSNAQPAAAALTRKGSVLHSRAKSLAAIVPKLNASNTSTPQKLSTPNRLIAEYFGGESAPIRLGPPVSPSKEKEESDLVMEYRSAFTERPPGRLRRVQTAPQNDDRQPNVKSTSWLGRKPQKFVAPKQQHQDDFVNMDINSSLFPNGPTDPLNPASFNELLLTASTLLLRMQAAYKEKVDYIASIRPEMDAQIDEAEEAETRATSLKNQLEDMSRRAHEQETTMKEMARELAEEKMKSFEAQQALALARTIRPVPSAVEVRKDGSERGTTLRRRGSSSNASDSGFESDIDSIFTSHSIPSTPVAPLSLSRMQSYDSAHESMREGNGRETIRVKVKPNALNANGHAQRLGREGAAWATVDVFRSENAELKKRVMELEETLQGCIELVSVGGGS